MVASAGQVDVAATVVGVAGALALTAGRVIGRALAGVTPATGGSWASQALDRAVPAAAGVVVGFLPVSWAGLAVVDWQAVAVAAVAAAGLALLGAKVDPPTPTV